MIEQHTPDPLRAALMQALDVLENVQDNINPERGYADELEADILGAIEQIRATLGLAPQGARS